MWSSVETHINKSLGSADELFIVLSCCNVRVHVNHPQYLYVVFADFTFTILKKL